MPKPISNDAKKDSDSRILLTVEPEGTVLDKAIISPSIVEGKAEMGTPEIILLNGNFSGPKFHSIEDALQSQKILLCVQGAALLINDNQKPIFVCKGTAIHILPRENWRIFLGRGSQEWLFAQWMNNEAVIPTVNVGGTRPFHTPSCSNVVRDLCKRAIEGVERLDHYPNFNLAWINMLVHERNKSVRHFQLTPVFQENLGAIEELVKAIREHPEKSWSLTEAAELAGYSPFHLSRLFKATANMGFPEFVDRCRCEIAIELLIDSVDSIALISERCGFGTPQALRTSMREFTGFLPSEFRMIPDGE
jgi:AraC-like DNA-binding protein